MMSSKIAPEIDAADICERLVGITPVYLQNFLQRGSYGLRSSVSPGKVRSKRRLFSPEDVYGIALVWILFETGLRGDSIARILNDIAQTKKPNANLAAAELMEFHWQYLLVFFTPRRPSKSIPQESELRVQLSTFEDLTVHLIVKDPDKGDEHLMTRENVVIINVPEKFEDVRRRLEILFQLR